MAATKPTMAVFTTSRNSPSVRIVRGSVRMMAIVRMMRDHTKQHPGEHDR